MFAAHGPPFPFTMSCSLFSRASAAVLRGALVVCLCLAAGRATAADVFPGLDAKWRHGRSEHFEVYGRVSESYAREILRNLETMRAAFLRTLELTADDSNEVTVYVFRSRENLRAYTSPQLASHENLIGEYRPGFDRDMILLDAEADADMAYWIIYADLTKNLLQGAGSRGPSWLFQGLAMLWGNFDARSGYSIAGRPDSLREKLVRENPEMDVEALFAVREGSAALPDLQSMRDKAQDTTNIFHAKSWVLLHYWYFGQKDVPASDVSRFVRFLLLSRAAQDPMRVFAEFQQTFKMDYAEMNRRVSRYMRSGRFNSRTIETPGAPAAASFAVRSVDAVEMRERLADLRLRTRRDDLAKFVLIDALRGPRAALAAAALGSYAAEDHDDGQAQDYWRRAIEAGTTNLGVIELALRLEFARRFRSLDYYYRLPAETAQELRGWIARVRQRAPDSVEFLEMLAWVEAAAPEPDVRNLNLVQAGIAKDRLRPHSLLAIALARARLGDRDSAISILTAIDQFAPRPEESRFALNVRRILRDPAVTEAE